MLKTVVPALVCFIFTATALSAEIKTVPKALPKTLPKTLNDTWYIMQAGSAPWGYYHEIIQELPDGKFSYKYELAKKDAASVYQEVIGALSENDLTPIAFSLVKSGKGATEMINATYKKEKSNGVFMVDIQGRRSQKVQRRCENGTILDVFFPVWLMKNWEKMKPNYRGWLMTFAEDQETNEFRPRRVQFEVLNHDIEKNCLHILAKMDNQKSDWCMNSKAQLIELKMNSVLVRRAKNEAEAKAVLKLN